jgi:membrane protein implicated in regulation of membrane protease activity
VELLQWYNIVFVAPIGLAAIYLILSASGIGSDTGHDLDTHAELDMHHEVELSHDVDMDHDVDVGHDVTPEHDLGADHDVAAEHEAQAGVEHEVHDAHFVEQHDQSFAMRALSVLGFGKVPVSILMTCLMVIFGATGLICNGLFAQVLPWKWAPTLYFWPSLGLAIAAAFSLTGLTARGLSRIMPTSETYAIKPTDLVGRIGTTVYAIKENEMGVVGVHDSAGDLHRVAARCDAGPLSQGEEVILVRYQKERDYYDVSRSPV